LINKLLILLPAALLLSAFLPWAITPILMLGGLYLAYEGAEKVMEKLGGEKHGETLADPIEDVAAFEKRRVSGAIRTDLILSAEIMAITLASVATESLINRALILAVVGVAITVVVYGAVALIVKMDDVGLHLAQRSSPTAQRVGDALVHAMPKLLTVLSLVGTIAMLWVGGGIILHGLEELGVHAPADIAHAIQHAVQDVTGALSGVFGWVTYAAVSALVGLALGFLLAILLHKVLRIGLKKAH
jgi:predicted DNA repair protein MutK